MEPSSETVSVRPLFRFLRPYRHWIALAPVAMGIEAAMDLAQPAFMKRIVDEGVSAGRLDVIRDAGWTMLLLALVGSLGGLLCTFVSTRAATGVGNDLRKALFSRVQRLSFAQTDRFTAGSLATRLTNDVTTVQFTVVAATRMMLRAPFLLFGSIALVLLTDWRLSLPLVLSAPVLAWIVVRFMSRMVPLFRERQRRTDALASSMQETLEGVRVVKAFAREGRVQDRFDALNEGLAETGLSTGFLGARLGPSLQIAQQATLVAIVFLAARESSAGLLKAGEILAIVNWSSQVMGALVMLSFHVMHFSRAAISARRVAEVLATEPDLADGPCAEPPADGSVEWRGVSFSYPGAAGDPVLRGAIGVVLQAPRLFSGTVAENLRWGAPEATDEEVEAAARVAQADGFVRAMPEGYATRIAQGGTTLSGGQRQRLCIARALLRRPKILILDDATSAVDPATERALRAALRERLGGTTVLTVAQRADSIRDADRIVVLEGGGVAGVGTHAELLRSCATYREIVESQRTAGTALDETGA